MMLPLVSVIIPTFNRPLFLEQALKSVLNQTYKNIEIIVVDDGTPGNDNEELCEKHEHIIYLRIENSGSPCLPRNIGIKESKGQYIAFLDDDDIWLPNKLERQVEVLIKNKDFGLAHSYCHIIDTEGSLLNEVVGRPRYTNVKHGDVLTKMIGNWTIMSSTPLIRKEIVNEVGFFNVTMPHAGEDVEYWSRLAFHTKFYYIDEPLVNYRRHETNVSNNKDEYVFLPLYLFKMVKRYYGSGSISKDTFKLLHLNLCLMQSKMVKTNFWKTIFNLFKINPFWFFKFRVHKTLIKKLIT